MNLHFSVIFQFLNSWVHCFFFKKLLIAQYFSLHLTCIDVNNAKWILKKSKKQSCCNSGEAYWVSTELKYCTMLSASCYVTVAFWSTLNTVCRKNFMKQRDAIPPHQFLWFHNIILQVFFFKVLRMCLPRLNILRLED